jgi:putative ATP-dependent endonuclease of the OLD family
MYLSRVQISNFRNFFRLDVALDSDVVIVGENRVGKSNFIFALRLVLDPSLPDSARQLKLSDVWDGHDSAVEPEISVHLDFAEFEDDPALAALLTDYRLAGDHHVARLSYVFRKKADIEGRPQSEGDFEFKVFGGGDETRQVKADVRRRICVDVLHALRDAESELGTWRSSPLRPLLDEAIGRIPEQDMNDVADEINDATTRMTALEPIQNLETLLRDRIANLAGPTQDVHAKLGFAPTDPLRLFRSIRVFIDDGRRSMSDASLGSANLMLLTLKLVEFEWRRIQNERDYTIVCVEEPEAHLHPHVQRSVFRKLFDTTDQPRSLLLTTHSPNIASVANLRSIVVLKSNSRLGTVAYSLAGLTLEREEREDLQRYLDVTRAEISFARAVAFVEGEAETALLPAFAQSLGLDLDELGISVCSVGGVNFRPYVKLAAALDLPFCVITDWDPRPGDARALGWNRSLSLLGDIRAATARPHLSPAELRQLIANETAIREAAAAAGIYMNSDTLELEVARTEGLVQYLLTVIEAERFGPLRQRRIAAWKADPSTIDGEQLFSIIADIGKGRLAGRLSEETIGFAPPAYIQSALEHIAAYGRS